MTHVTVQFSRQSQSVIRQQEQRGRRLVRSIEAALRRGAVEIEAEVKQRLTSRETSPTTRRNRTGNLRQSIDSQVDGTTLIVGSRKGPAEKYARLQLGAETVKIRPVNSKFLWIPAKRNQTASGVTRMTPSAAISEGKIRIVINKAGTGGVALLDRGRSAISGKKLKSWVMFYLTKEVTVTGSDALGSGVRRKVGRLKEMLEDAIADAIA